MEHTFHRQSLSHDVRLDRREERRAEQRGERHPTGQTDRAEEPILGAACGGPECRRERDDDANGRRQARGAPRVASTKLDIARRDRSQHASGANDPQSELLFEWVEVAISVQQHVIVLETERRDQAIDGLSDGVAPPA